MKSGQQTFSVDRSGVTFGSGRTFVSGAADERFPPERSFVPRHGEPQQQAIDADLPRRASLAWKRKRTHTFGEVCV
ncbi:hypothetical protein EDC90_10483 [Martelella mediterranea]|uniref:Uncharacterized protein n=1 Tax=Martelella mediterranea TaxID=293089 RepID=A0A4R3NEE8_9HYPH|nr:hypothetical protein EDC90_10483 [Martelella mediterranea]